MLILPKNVAEHMVNDEIKREGLEKFADNPICPKCEKIAYRDIGWTKNRTATCPHCGYKGKMSVTVRDYIRKRLYR